MGAKVSTTRVNHGFQKCSVLEAAVEAGKVKVAEQLKLNLLLNNSIDYQILLAFARTCGHSYLLSIWYLIQDCESNYSCHMDFTSLGLALMPHENIFPMYSEFVRCYNNNKRVHAELKLVLNNIKICCFQLIHIHIYKPFISTSTILDSEEITNAKIASGLVACTKFDYLNVIAKGGFGVVVQVRMKSTGKICAMKIQPKISLLRQFRNDKSRITSELAASVVFNHPYIAEIACAFHTETLTMLVSPFSACGDLRAH